MMLVLLLLFVYVSFFFFVGILGNLMVIYVYLLKWRVNMFCVFILVFGLYDFINCVMLLIMEIVLFFWFLNFDFLVWCKVFWFLLVFINSGLMFIFVVIVMDCFLRICKIYKDFIFVELVWSFVFIFGFFVVFMLWLVLLLYGLYIVIIFLKLFVFVKGKICLVLDSMVEIMYLLIFVIFLLFVYFLVDIVLIVLYLFVGWVIYY